ncbi:uncharacterized protein BO88DRAFT_240779 [Aspergillus vadensis CBS 113365]|uniref:Secreted protein n=1 Tax=Aspergillus vadensis (strain CBS 113365 / IMI 142717 / IBT 24658) TaxID=1448311 RepID=A0A319C8W8_ASPVC|nr:hypothetical protein BO88DRAFT_240779 [Aspergillus vadensis CBS 113365]PYH71788.1 hypothetical protein BO88DRAFT_240779 [Aspergillus vadensis CBS 113365]
MGRMPYAACCMLLCRYQALRFMAAQGTSPKNCVCGELVRRGLSLSLILNSRFVRSSASTSCRAAVIDPLIDRHHTLESGSIGVDDLEAIYRT